MLLLLGLTPVAALAEGSVVQPGPEADSGTVPLDQVATDPAGSGVWERAACAACSAGFLMLGGTSIIGAAAAVLAFPEFAAACGLTCAYAFR
jgi:hypothetical protein